MKSTSRLDPFSRTPKRHSQSCRSSHPDIDELKDIVDDILRDDRRASEVIRRMRSLLKKAPFEPKSIDLNELVRETVEFLSALAAGREVKLGSLISPAALPIVGDRIQLQQVILNLVVNAIDAMADTPGDDRLISIRTSRVENFAELAISDHGPGIAEDRLKEVFEPFVTSKSKGMGMGLSIARTIVEAHDGQICGEQRARTGCGVPDQVTDFPLRFSWVAFRSSWRRRSTHLYRRAASAGTFGSRDRAILATPGIKKPEPTAPANSP